MRNSRIGILSSLTASKWWAMLFCLGCGQDPALPDESDAPKAKIYFPPSGVYSAGSTIVVRGTAMASDHIVSVQVNGTPATTVDGYAHWQGTAQINIGPNPIQVTVTDTKGRSNSKAAQVLITGQDWFFRDSRGIVVNATETQAFVIDHWNVLVGIDLKTGRVRRVSGGGLGKGPPLRFVHDLCLDETNNRILVADGGTDTVMAIDIKSGDRNVLSSVNLSLPTGISHRPSPSGDKVLVSDVNRKHIVLIPLNGGNPTSFLIEVTKEFHFIP